MHIVNLRNEPVLSLPQISSGLVVGSSPTKGDIFFWNLILNGLFYNSNTLDSTRTTKLSNMQNILMLISQNECNLRLLRYKESSTNIKFDYSKCNRMHIWKSPFNIRFQKRKYPWLGLEPTKMRQKLSKYVSRLGRVCILSKSR